MPEGEDRKRLVRQLKLLRGSRGLTRTKLTKSPSVLEALGTNDVNLAYDRLLAAVGRLGDDQASQALRAAYGLDPRHTGTLGERRASFARSEKVFLGPERIEDLENEAINELVLALQSRASIRPELEVCAGFKGGHMGVLVEMDGANLQETGIRARWLRHHMSIWKNRESLPFFIYQMPQDNTYSVLRLAVCAFDNSLQGLSFVSCMASTLTELSFAIGSKDYSKGLRYGPPKSGSEMHLCSVIWTDPQPDFYYCVYWTKATSEEPVVSPIEPT